MTARKVEGASARASLPAAFAAMHLGWGLGFWQELIRVGRDDGWGAELRLLGVFRGSHR
jgi:hypothetical protein